MRVLVASDDEQVAQRIWQIVARTGLEGATGHTISLELVADRASRLVPELLVLVLPSDPASALRALRETSNTVQKAHVLVVGPATDAKLILDVLHGGAHEYLDQSLLETELAAAIVRLKAKQASPPQVDRAGHVISVLAPSGGSGSSVLAANLGTALAEWRGECGLIDLGLTAGDLAAMLNVKPPHTIADLCDRLARVDQSMFEQFFTRHSSGVHLLAAPHSLADIQKVTPRAVRRAVALARVRFPYVVIDVDNAFSGEQVEALWQSDVILLVLRLDYTSIRNTRRVMDNLKGLGIGLDRVQLVANRYRQARQLRVSEAEEALGIRVLHCVPDDPARVNRAVNKGIPVILQRPLAKVSRSIVNLARSVNGRYKE
jgi:pilus assembly protein CpaE